MPRIIEFEGRRIELPDDATDAEVAQALGATAAPAAAPPAAPPSMVDTIMSSAKSAVGMGDKPAQPAAPDASGGVLQTAAYLPRGVRRGAANIAGIFVDTANAGLGLAGLPVSQKPVMGSRWIDEALGLPGEAVAAGVNALGGNIKADLPPPSTTAQHILSRTGEEIGAAALPVGAAINAGKMGVEAARKLPLLARMFVEPAAINPVSFARKEAATAAAAGAGAGVANEVTDLMGAKKGGVAHNVGDMAGAITGAGVLGASRVIAKPIGDLASVIFNRDKFSNRVVTESVVDKIANNASTLEKKAGEAIDTQPLVDAIMRGDKVSATIPGFKESVADRTRDPGVAALEYGRQTGGNAGEYVQQRTTNTAAVDNAMKKIEPQGNPADTRATLEAARAKELTDAATTTGAVQSTFDQHLQRLQPVMTGEGRGADIRAALEGASDGAKAIVDKAWKPLNSAEHSVDMKPLADDFRKVGDGMSVAERERFQPSEAGIPKRLSGEQPVVPERLSPDGTPVTEAITQPINEVTGLRSALTDAAREAGSNGRTNEARVINQHIDALDSYLDNAVPPELRQQYDQARAATKDFHDRFTRPQTAIAQTLDRQQGLYRQPDSAVAGKFVQADEGRVADFQALMKEAGNDARVVPAVRDQILADVRDRKLLDNPEALGQYIERYNTVLSDKRFASVRRELSTAEGLRGALDTAAANEARLGRELGTPGKAGTSTVGKYLQYGDERAQDALKGVIANKEPGKAIDELLNFAGNEPKAVEGARKAFWDLMQSKTRSAGETTKTLDGTQPWMPRALKGFLEDPAHAAVAERLYRDNPEHLADLKKITEALQGVDLRSRAKAANTSGTAQGVSAIMTPETLQSRFYAYKRGQTSLGFMVTALASVAARRAVRGAQAEAIEKLLDRALLDPALAAQLLKDNNPANRAAMARTAKAWMGNEADTLMKTISGDGRTEDPTAEGVMRGKDGR